MGKGSSPRNCFSSQFKNNYDDIFMKLTGEEWALKLNIMVQSLDCWDSQDFKSKKIGRQEFLRKIAFSTISIPVDLIKELTGE